MLQVTLRQLTYFIAAAETGSIAEAARVVNVAQPSVSWAILKMEDSLSVDLFVRRHAKGVSLTPAGNGLLPLARHLVRLAEEFEITARSQTEELTGKLVVGSYSTLTAAFLPQIISEFSRRHPGVSIEIFDGLAGDVYAGLTNGEIEVALAYDVDLPEDILKLKVHSAKPYALLPESHPMLTKEAVSLHDLKDEPFVLLSSTPAKPYFLSLFDSLGIEPKIVHTSPSFEIVRGLVAHGLGYSVLVTRPASDTTYDGLRVHSRTLTDDLPKQSMCVIRAPTSRMTRRCKAFQDICVDLFSAGSPMVIDAS